MRKYVENASKRKRKRILEFVICMCVCVYIYIFRIEYVVPANVIKYNETKQIFVLMKRNIKSLNTESNQNETENKSQSERSKPPTAVFHNILKFVWKEVDSVTGKYIHSISSH
jgi:hypothetical protein